MKGRGFIVFVGLIGIIAFSCKKDINPKVTFTVVDTLGTPLVGATVFTHPCFDGTSCNTQRVNENFIKGGETNGAGQITYEFPYTAIIEVVANWECDSVPPPGQWSCYSSRSVTSFESKRTSADEENNYDVTLVLKIRYE